MLRQRELISVWHVSCESFFNGTELKGLPVISGPTVEVFDASRYITTKGTRNARWRMNFNGLGSLSLV